MTTYVADVTQEDGQWLGDIPEFEGASTYASTLPRLVEYLREVAVLAADLPDDADVVVELRFAEPDLADGAAIRRDRERLAAEADELVARTAEVVNDSSTTATPCATWQRPWASVLDECHS